jgi:hypothetical protein
MTMGPEPMTRTDCRSSTEWARVYSLGCGSGGSLGGRGGHEVRRSGRTGCASRADRPRTRGGTGPRRPACRGSARPSTTSSLSPMWLTSHAPEIGRSAVRLDGLAAGARRPRSRGSVQVISTRPGGGVQHRLVDAAVAEHAACRCRSPGPCPAAGCRSRCRRTGSDAASTSRQHARPARSAVAGSPGPLEKNTPSGRSALQLSRRGSPRAPRGPRCRVLRELLRGHGLDAEVEGRRRRSFLGPRPPRRRRARSVVTASAS